MSGATSFGELDVYTRSTIYDLPGEVVWAGHRDDSFFSDIPGIFDLLDVRILDNNGTLADGLGQDGNGVDGFKGFNVLSVAMQIPVSDSGARHPDAYDSVFFGQQTGVGVYATVSRPRMTVRKDDGTRGTRAAGRRCRGSAIRSSPKGWSRSRTRIGSTARRRPRTRRSRPMRATRNSRR